MRRPPVKPDAQFARSEIERAAHRGRSPLVDPGGVTFVYRGAAEAVHLRLWIHGLPATQPFEQPADDLWVLRIEVPENSRIEYKFAVARDGRDEWILDPLNPAAGRGSVRRQFRRAGSRLRAAGLDAAGPDRARAGTLEDLVVHSAALGGERHIGVYVPARFRRSAATRC